MLVLVPHTGQMSLAMAKSKGLTVRFSLFFFCFFCLFVSGNNSTIILLPRLVTSEASLHPPFPSLPSPNQSLNPSDSVFSTPRTSLLRCLSSRPAVPNLFGTRDQCCGRQFSHRLEGRGWFGDDLSVLHLLFTSFHLLALWSLPAVSPGS